MKTNEVGKEDNKLKGNEYQVIVLRMIQMMILTYRGLLSKVTGRMTIKDQMKLNHK